jgi:small subunit ribosomal protein S20
MPIKRSAEKALRQSKKRAARNQIYKDAYKQAVKDVRKALEVGEKEVSKKISSVQKTLGKAAKKGVLSKKTAARKVSRLMKKANKLVK